MARRSKLLKLPNRYTGWVGEDCWRSEGRRFLKRLEHRAKRRFADRQIKEEIRNA